MGLLKKVQSGAQTTQGARWKRPPQKVFFNASAGGAEIARVQGSCGRSSLHHAGDNSASGTSTELPATMYRFWYGHTMAGGGLEIRHLPWSRAPDQGIRWTDSFFTWLLFINSDQGFAAPLRFPTAIE